MIGEPVRDSATGMVKGPKYIYPWGLSYKLNEITGKAEWFIPEWEPIVGEDIRDMRDPETVGKEYLARDTDTRA